MERKRGWWQISPREKKDLIDKIVEDARYNEVHYYGCSQSVLQALQKNLGIGNNDVFKAASALGGGVGMGEVCGAVTGGVMAIGLVYGRQEFNEKVNAHHDPVYLECRRRNRYFCELFIREYGYLTCRDIKYQARGIYPFKPSKLEPAPEDWEKMERNHDKCGEVCARAARLAAEAILEQTIDLTRFELG